MIGLIIDKGHIAQHRGHIVSFWVKPAYRSQGIGKKLIEHLQKLAPSKQLRKLYLQVTSSQTAAIKLYESLGFIHTGTLHKHVLHSGQYYDMHLMEWHTKG